MPDKAPSSPVNAPSTPAACIPGEVYRLPLSWLNPAPYNPRVDLQPGDPRWEALAAGIDQFGCVETLVWNRRTGNLVGGHQRLKVLLSRGHLTHHVFVVDLDLPAEQALNLLLNNPRAAGDWDVPRLGELVRSLSTTLPAIGLDPGITGWSSADLDKLLAGVPPNLLDAPATPASRAVAPDTEGARQRLAERFGVPPFSVLDARQGYWQERKRAWRALGVDAEEGKEYLQCTVMKTDWMQRGASTGGSVFDPVLAELVVRWFSPANGAILDPFAGEATKGIVTGVLGHPYTGIEIRQQQVDANRQQWQRVRQRHPADAPLVDPVWINGDSAALGQLLPQGALYDLIFTSPPYYDLEVYQGGDQDGSTLPEYADFMRWYEAIFAQAVARLWNNRFLVVKVGEIRDSHGVYRNFIGDNIACFLRLGLTYYNEAVLVVPVGSLPLRIGRQFPASRKLGKGHQNVLVFYKGDPATIPQHFPKEVECELPAQDAAAGVPGEGPACPGDR